jgi:hypothetical protein
MTFKCIVKLVIKLKCSTYADMGFCVYSQQWLLDRQDLIRERQQDLIVLTEEEYQKIFIFFSNCKLNNKFKFCVQF